MSSKKCCNTINLAKISVEKLKKCQPPKPSGPRRNENVPPSPRVVKNPQILLCKPRPVEFKYPGAPCLCPPCPVCPTLGERIKKAVVLSLKLLGVYTVGKLTIDGGLWGPPDLAASLIGQLPVLAEKIIGGPPSGSGKCNGTGGGPCMCLICIEENFCDSGPSGPSKVFDAAINLWNKLISALFYATVGFPADIRHRAETQLYYILSGEAARDKEKAKKEEEEEKKKKALEHHAHESEDEFEEKKVQKNKKTFSRK